MIKYNLKSIIVALLVFIIGILLIIGDIVVWKTQKSLWVSIGCSLIASSLVIILTELLVDRKKINPLDEWGIEKIYSSRAERNRENDPYLDKAKYCIDGIAFGLSSFRVVYSKKVEACLKKGVNIRLLTMNPSGRHVSEREKEENVSDGSIEKSIKDLVIWANGLNDKNMKGKIIVKAYDCMTLDFYWRVDDELFVGPYWYGYKSTDTITYKFVSGGKGFTQFTEYFDHLWDNKDITTTLTKIEALTPRKKRK